MAQQVNGRYSDIANNNSDITNLTHREVKPKQDQASVERDFDQWFDQGYWLVFLLLPIALLSFKRGIILLLICIPVIGITPNTAYAFSLDNLWLTQDQQAQKALNAGDAKAAAEQFQSPEWQAAAQYRAGDYSAAAKSFAKSDSATAHYNRGNALAKSGDLEGAIKAYDEALKRNQNLADAKQNRALTEAALKRQQQQQKEQKEQKEQEKNQQQDKKDQKQNSEEGEDQNQDDQNKDNQSKDGNKDQQNREQENQQSDKDAQQNSEQQSQEDKKEQSNQDSSEQSTDTQSENSDGQSQSSATGNAKPHEQASSGKPQAATDAGQQQSSAAAADDNQSVSQDSANDSSAGKQAEKISAATEEDKLANEQQQALEQWLRRVPDDPGGLLRNKFRWQYQQNRQKEAYGEFEPPKNNADQRL